MNRRKGQKTKVLAAVLSASMVMSLCPMTAAASSVENENGSQVSETAENLETAAVLPEEEETVTEEGTVSEEEGEPENQTFSEDEEVTADSDEETTEETILSAEGELENQMLLEEEEVEDQTGGVVFAGTYILMNIPYDDFYKAELKNNTEAVDAFTSATQQKSRGSMVNGSYHTAAINGDDPVMVDGVTYPVLVTEETDLSVYTQVIDTDSISITTTNRGQTSTVKYNGKDVLFERPDYSYYVLSETPTYYKELSGEAGSFSFSEVKTAGSAALANVVENVGSTFLTTTNYGEYQLNLSDISTESGAIGNGTRIYGVVINTIDENGNNEDYGLRHMENIWLGTQLSWCAGITTAVHGCPTSSDHYISMMGNTITAVTYYTDDGIYQYDIEDTKVPIKFGDYAVTVGTAGSAASSAGTAAIVTTGIPQKFLENAEYTVKDLAGAAGTVNAATGNGTLTWMADSALPGTYTLTITDTEGTYAALSTSFILTTEAIVVQYDGADAALKAADGYDADDLANYLGNITKVSVDGTSYAASGRDSTVIINADGSVKTDAAPIVGEGSYQIVVTATGYPDFSFTYTVEAPVKVNTAALEAAIKKAKALNESLYTAASWKKFQTVLAAAETALSADTQNAVDTAAANLTAAFDELVAKNGLPFSDVPEASGWRYEAVKYVYDNGIMNGISGTRRFDPDENLTRAMFATIIYRMEGSPSTSYTAKFPDVPSGNYYSLPVIWANNVGIINGHSNTGLFGTYEDITREDLVVIMYRYCSYKGYSTSNKDSLSAFADAGEISGYAKEAMQWAVGNGIINGRSNTGLLDPKGNATRVEAAAIIQRFMQKYVK